MPDDHSHDGDMRDGAGSSGAGGQSHTAEAIQEWLVDRLARRLGMAAKDIDAREPFAGYGLGSLQAVELAADLEVWLGWRLSPTLAWEYPTAETLARHLAEGAASSDAARSARLSVQPDQVPPIAIIGMACRFPGATGLDAYWELLKSGTDAVREVPPERWDVDDFFDPDPATPGKAITRSGGFIGDIDLFDAQFFGISPREATRMDPQQRILMETVWEAFEDAGLVAEELSGERMGVFIGLSHNDYGRMQMNPAFCDPHMLTGNAGSIAANRVSYRFNLRGPSMTVDTACSSSLVATHLACRSLWNGESALALVGSACLMLSPTIPVNFSKAGMLSPDGRCKAFDASADGFGRGEGAGVLVLKPLADAIGDGDHVHAVIRGSAVNSDGRTNGMTAPSREAQEAVIMEACARGQVAPADIAYIEAHGTGTALGDPIEAKALGAVLSVGRSPDHPCVIGSAKTNIGHLESVSGLAGIIKAALCLENRGIPPSLHFEKPNPHIPFDALPLRVQQALGPWPEYGDHLLAGVNSFGFGGTNAHVVMEEPPKETLGLGQRRTIQRPYIMTVSGKTADALVAQAGAFAEFLEAANDDEVDMHDVCFTAAVRRTHLDHRLIVAGRSRQELAEPLEAFHQGQRRPGLVAGAAGMDKRPKVAFVFAGQGPQWWAMGRQLLDKEPVFRITLQKCDELFRELAGWSIRDALRADEANCRLHDTEVAQPALFALQVGLAALWRSWGIVPDAVVGHSVGEVAAAHVAGVLSFEDAVQVIYHRGRFMQQATGMGKMAVVGMPLAEAEKMLASTGGKVSLGAVNGAASLTLSGEAAALEALLAQLDETQVFHKMLPVNYAFHSAPMGPIAEAITDAIQGIIPREARLPIYSTLTGQALEGEAFDAAYWGRNVAQSVQFLPALDALIDDEHTVFLELSPHPTLVGDVRRRLREREADGMTLSSLVREGDDQVNLLTTLGSLHTAGFRVDWRRLYPERRRCVTLPSYQWQRQRHWLDLTEDAIWDGAWRGATTKSEHPFIREVSHSAHPCIDVHLLHQKVPYLTEHKVQGAEILPGAGFVEMALAAAATRSGLSPAILTDMELRKPLFISPHTGERLQVVFTPEDAGRSAFHIYSKEPDSGGDSEVWNLHAAGWAVAGDQSSGVPSTEVEPSEVIQARCTKRKTAEEFYASLERVGLDYGPLFRGVEHVWYNDAESLARVCVPEAVEAELDAYRLHPALLDACIQTLASVIPGAEEAGAIYLPVRMGRVQIHGQPGPSVWCYVRLLEVDDSVGLAVEVDITILDENMRPLVEVTSFRAQQLDSNTFLETRGADPTTWLYEVVWEPQARPGETQPLSPADFLPDPASLAARLEPELERLSHRYGFEQYCQDAAALNAELCRDFVVAAFRRLGWDTPVGERVTSRALAERLGVVAGYHRLFSRLLEILEGHGVLAKDGTTWEVVKPADPGDPDARCEQYKESKPALDAELTLLRRCGTHLPEVLRGECDARSLLFPEGSFGLLVRLYQEATFARVYNAGIEKAIAAVIEDIPPRRPIRILELGAGTGSTTSYVLPKLPPRRTEYVFTDISGLFLVQAERKFAEYPFVTYRTLDIESDPGEQGFAPHEFDLIVAANVIHAASDVRNALTNVLSLLNSRGLLMMLESTAKAATFDMIFGLLQELWEFTDTEVRPDHMLLSQERWCSLLEETGFAEAVSLPGSANAVRDPSHQAIVLARGPEVVNEEPEQDDVVLPPREKTETWLLLTDEGALGPALAERLTSLGKSCVTVLAGTEFVELAPGRFRVPPASADGFRRVLDAMDPDTPLRGLVHLWSARQVSAAVPTLSSLEEMQDRTCLALRELIRAVEERELDAPPRLWVVTRGAQDVLDGERGINVATAPVWSLGRVLSMEHWKLAPTNIDLPSSPCDDEADWLVKEFWADTPEDQVAFRPEGRYVKRLVHEADGSGIVSQDRATRQSGDTPARLEVDKPGMIESVSLRSIDRPQAGLGEVVVRVVAAGVNFRDVMKVLGIYPTAAGEPAWLGDECAGTVVEAGAGVKQFKPGDDVIVIGPDSFSSYVTAPAEAIIPKPARLSLEEASGLPTVFLTAYYALHHLARLREGERVLIHAAAGGVGIAAVQLAKRAGAEIYATAGTPEKRAFVQSMGVEHVMNSRTLDFAGEVMRLTDGEGVDVVLNSLAGEAIAKSLTVLRTYGRFLEIGKRDIYENSHLGLGVFKKNQSFHAIDLAQVFRDRPELITEMLDDIMGLLASGEIEPLPVQVFPASDAAGAFRHMAQAKHVGKVVLSFAESEVPIKPPKAAALALREDGTYLITGGLGGFGLAVAKWLADKGVRHLVLTGRSGAARPEAAQAVADLEQRGVKVGVFKADAANTEQMAAVFEAVSQSMPPVRGVIHSAMVLDDVPFLDMTDERFWNVVKPKMHGAWNLHTLTKGMGLDFFVLFSSASSVLGAPGQGNYGPANEFMSTLAHRRRTQGLPATAINWGRLGDVGYVAEHAEVSELLDRYGIQTLPLVQTLQVFERILIKSPVQVGVMKMDWDLLRTLHPAGVANPLLLHLETGAGQGAGRTHGGLRREDLAALSSEECQERLESHIRQEIAEVLQLDAAGVDIHVPMNSLGLDSLVGIELKARLETDLRVKMPMALLMQGPTISELAAHFQVEIEGGSEEDQSEDREVVEIDDEPTDADGEGASVSAETSREELEL